MKPKAMAARVKAPAARPKLPNNAGTKAKPRTAPAPVTVNAWEDDPGSGANPTGGTEIKRLVPTLGAQPFALSIENPAKAPAVQSWALGTPGFRYWAAAEALRRAADFWAGILPSPRWQPGAVLPVDLEHGIDLNAFYDRVGLRFFKQTVAGRTVYSGESPDVLCHELGHAILDSVVPALWDAASAEIGAFHESFGDISALLSALQLPSLRDEVLKATGGSISRSSNWSRLAEQLGWAIRLGAPDAVDPDCLRNAANSFSYQDPRTLPQSAPASQLSREVHSFSRVFTGAAFDGLAGMLKARSATDSANLQQASADFAKIITTAARGSPVSVGFYRQVAARMVLGADTLFPGAGYGPALNGAFVKHAILSPANMAGLAASPAEDRAAALSAPAAFAELQELNAEEYGLGVREIALLSPYQPPQYNFASPARSAAGAAEPERHLDIAKSYLEDLLSSGRVRVGFRDPKGMAAHATGPSWRHTHELREEGGRVVLRRLRMNCGLDECTCHRETS